MKTGFVILAAGAGRRMGGVAKCLLELDGRSLLERLLTHLQPLRGKARHDLVLVLGHHAHDIQAQVARLPAAIEPLCVINPRPEDDTASSLRAFVAAHRRAGSRPPRRPFRPFPPAVATTGLLDEAACSPAQPGRAPRASIIAGACLLR